MLDCIDPRFDEIDDERDRVEAWTQAVSTVARPTLHPDVPVPRFARFHSWRIGGLILNEVVAPAQVFERTPYQIASQGVDHLVLSLHTSGRSSLLDMEGERPVPLGSIRISDMSQQYQLRSFGMRGLNVFIPRRYVDRRLGDVSGFHQLVIGSREKPLVKLLADQVRNTHACIEQIDELQEKHLADGIISAVNAVLGSLDRVSRETPKILSIEIRRFIEANLARNDLDVEVLRTEFGVSRTPIYEIFEEEGGVMTYVRNRRLAWAMRMLSGLEGGPRKRVSEVAYSCGYDTLKAFSKAFKSKYGIVPRDVGATHGHRVRGETGTTLQTWIQAL